MHMTQIMAVLLVGVLLINGACAPVSVPASPSAPPPAPELNGFTVSDLRIPDIAESSGAGLEVSVNVTNNGKKEGTHTLMLWIDDTIAQTQNVTLAAGASRHVTFTINIDQIGNHKITVDQLSGDLHWLGPN
ncbi:MAG: CARDB domain-containing protein [Dehalococcoidales bacterium]|nr:CARDB domain-containing protein [Dehalococcoidales bacterium]